MYGLGMEVHNYGFTSDFSFVPDMDVLTLEPVPKELKKNKLVSTGFSVPLTLGLETNPYNKFKSFRIAGGGFVGVVARAHTKQKDGDKRKVKQADSYNLNRLRYGVTGTIGYGPINFYLNYNFSSLFKKDEGPEITPLSVGIAIRYF